MYLKDIKHKIDIIEDMRELKELNTYIRNRIKSIQNGVKYELKIGDRVEIRDRKPRYGIIKKINKTRIVVSIDENTTWRVPCSMIIKKEKK